MAPPPHPASTNMVPIKTQKIWNRTVPIFFMMLMQG